MSDQPSAPRRILRRAGNLLTSNGRPVVKELELEVASPDNDLAPLRSSLQRGSSRKKLSASIKRKFKEVKDDVSNLGRSRSMSVDRRPVHDEAAAAVLSSQSQSRKGHARSQSDSLRSRPPIVHHSNSAPPLPSPPPMQHRQSLSTVSEAPPHPSPPPTPGIVAAVAEGQAFMGDVSVPRLLQQGTHMTKVSNKKHKKALFRIDPDHGQIVWESKKHRIIPIESIKELRSGSDARYYREQFQLAQDYEDRWLTIVYILDGNYKTLHLIAATKDVFRMWDVTLRKMYAVRQELMSGLGNGEMRQAMWEKHYWKRTDEESDQKLTFEEVEKLCKRLNISSSTEDLLRLFKQADTQNRNYLDFEDFRRFVKLLKGRPEIDRLYKKLRAANGGAFDFVAFENFMRDKQKSSLSKEELQAIFNKYSSSDAPASPPIENHSPSPLMTLDSFTSFLLSPDNSAFSDQHGKVWHDMTRPLSDYYVSSSHNTYLVGHQLVGVSTIEGYIRALLHSCRSVELDIYDGDHEPMIFHGKTFTSKVSLREVCQAIAKYGFVASPYPIIISAEIHCGIAQQDMMVDIMTSVFGDALIRAPINGRPKIEALPSPEDLKGMILLKAKNLYVSRHDSLDSDVSTADTSTSSASDSEALLSDGSGKPKRHESDAVKELKEEFLKARAVLQRVRSVGKSSSALARSQSQSRSPSQTQSPPTTPMKIPHTPSMPMPLPLSSPPALSVSGSPAPPSTPMRHRSSDAERPKPKMSLALLSLLVYTVGVKCRGINKKEEYAPEHMFSLSENVANKMLKAGMVDLIKHNRSHLVRIYPKGLRLSSTNYEPHRYWSAGAQLVAINWQTFDLGYMINHAMFQRNGRSGYVLKPSALRAPHKDHLSKRTNHFLDLSIISAQQLPRAKDASGHEIMDKSSIDPFVEVSIHVPDWTDSPLSAEVPAPPPVPALPGSSAPLSTSPPRTTRPSPSPPALPLAPNATSARTISYRTGMVKNNGFNPVWEEKLQIPFDCVGDMRDLVFVRFAVRHGGGREDEEPLAVYCASLGSLQYGYRHLPLHDTQLSQYLFSTLFVRINVIDRGS